MNKALAGLVVALTLGVGLAVGVLAGGIISPDAHPRAGRGGVHLAVPVAVVHARADGLPGTQRRRRRRRVAPSPTAAPSPTPEPTPSLVPGAADRPAREARGREPPRRSP